MIDQFVSIIMQRVKDRYPGIDIPAGMQAVITSVTKTKKTYEHECKITRKDNGKEYECKVERYYYIYTVKILDNNGSQLEKYPELIKIESRQQLKKGDVVQVVFLANELEAAIVGG